MDSATTITVILSIAGGLVTGGALLSRAVLGWAREVAALRKEIAALRLEMEQTRSADRIEVRDLVRAELREHVAGCPARETTGARAVEV